MIDLERYNLLKKRADKAKSETERAEGALEQQFKRLKDDFGCETEQAAEAKLRELEARENELGTAYNEALQDFETQYGKLL